MPTRGHGEQDTQGGRGWDCQPLTGLVSQPRDLIGYHNWLFLFTYSAKSPSLFDFEGPEHIL